MMSEDEIRALIAKRAYELYRQRQAGEGDEVNDWLRAETEVMASVSPASVDLREGDLSPSGGPTAQTVDEGSVRQIAQQALADLGLDFGVREIAPVPGDEGWCVSFPPGYGQVCVTAGPGATSHSIKEEIKQQLLNRGTS